MSALTVTEIFKLVDDAPTKDAKLQLLKKYSNEAVKTLLVLNYHPTVKMDLPEGEPPYKKDETIPLGYSDTSLLQEVHRFYVWIKPEVNLTKIKKESLFMAMLEGLHHTEAEILCLCKDHKITKKYKTLKEDLVREAYPGMLPEKKSKKPETQQPEKESAQPSSN